MDIDIDHQMLMVPLIAILAFIRFRQMFQGKRLPSRRPAGALTVQDVARAYGVSLREVRRWIGDGLVAVRLGKTVLIREDDIARFFEEHRDRGFGQREPAPASTDAWQAWPEPEPVLQADEPRVSSPNPPMEEYPDSPPSLPEPPEFPPWTPPLYEPSLEDLDLELMDLPCN